MAEPATQRDPFNVRCGKCGHVWTAAWLPMEASLFAKVTGKPHCPSCGNGPKAIYVAQGETITGPPTERGEKTS